LSVCNINDLTAKVHDTLSVHVMIQYTNAIYFFLLEIFQIFIKVTDVFLDCVHKHMIQTHFNIILLLHIIY